MPTLEQKNKSFFNRWAGNYGNGLFFRHYFNPLYRRITETLEQEAGEFLNVNSQIVDAACGTGEVIHRLATKYSRSHFTGVDFVSEMIKQAQEKNVLLKNTHLEVANVTQLPFSDNTCDVVFCSEAFHHFAAPERALNEIFRVLKPGGIFLLVDPAFNNWLAKAVGLACFKWIEHAKAYYSRPELVGLITQAGFTVTKSFIYNWNNFVIGKK